MTPSGWKPEAAAGRTTVVMAVPQASREVRVRKLVRLGEIVHVAALDPIDDQLRTRGRRSRLEVVDGDLPGPDPFESFESADRLQRIGGARAELDPRDREILLGTLVDGSTPGERR